METVVREKRKYTKFICEMISSNDTPSRRRTPSRESGIGGWQSRSSRHGAKECLLADVPRIGPSHCYRLRIEKSRGLGAPAFGACCAPTQWEMQVRRDIRERREFGTIEQRKELPNRDR